MSEMTDLLDLVTKKFQMQSEEIKQLRDIVAALKDKEEQKVDKLDDLMNKMEARNELQEDQIAELDRLTQRESTQLKVMIQLTETLEKVRAQ